MPDEDAGKKAPGACPGDESEIPAGRGCRMKTTGRRSREQDSPRIVWASALAEAVQILESAGVPDAAYDARFLLEHVSGKNRAWLFLHGTEEMPEDIRSRFEALICRRAERIPLQHLTGAAWFMGFPFRVNGHVLVPRPDTEKLVEVVLEVCSRRAEAVIPDGGFRHGEGAAPDKGSQHAEETAPVPAGSRPWGRLLDLCTGSGCIAVSLAKQGRFAEVTASDISPEALAVAGENVRTLCPGQVKLCRSDLFAELAGERFDVIVSNPPYIPSGEIPGLMPEVKDHDPSLALDGGADGLDIYRRLAEECPEHLLPGGRIFWEIGWNQAEDVTALLRSRGFSDIDVYRDDAGRNRVITAVRRGG